MTVLYILLAIIWCALGFRAWRTVYNYFRSPPLVVGVGVLWILLIFCLVNGPLTFLAIRLADIPKELETQ